MKKLIYISFSLLMFTSLLYAQNEEIDSLENELSLAEPDTNRVLLLNTLAYKLHTYNPEKGISHARESIRLASSLEFDKGRAHAYNSLGAGYWNQGEFDSALLYYTKSYQLNDTLGNARGVTGALSNMAIIFDNRGDYSKSIEFYTRALEEMEKNGFDSYIAITSNNLGLILLKLGRHAEALDYFNRAIKIGEPLEMTNLVGPAWINIGKVYKETEEPQKQEEAINTALKIGRDTKSKYVTALAINNLGRFHDGNGDFEKALSCYKEALAINTEVGRKRSISSNLNNIGSTYRKLGLYDSAIQSIQKAQKIALEINHRRAVVTTYYQLGLTLREKEGCSAGLSSFIDGYSIAEEAGELVMFRDISKSLSECYFELKQFEKAYHYQNQFIMASDSLINEENIKELAMVEANYEFESQLAAKDNEIMLLEAHEQVSNLKLLLGLGTALIILIVGFFIARNKLKAKALQNEHFKAIGKFKEAMTGMIAHDLKNPLGIILSTESEKHSTRQMARQMLNLVNNMLDVHKFESIEVVLSPAPVSLHSLLSDAVEQVRPLLSQKNMNVQLSIDPKWVVKADQNYMLRVFVNLLTNAIKYSPVNDYIEINGVSNESGLVEIEVKDHGSGIAKNNLEKIFENFSQLDPKASGGVASTGLGLSFCRLAVRAHGSELSVVSELKKGTAFKFSLPLYGETEEVARDFSKEFVFKISEEDRDLIISKIPELRSKKLHQAFAIEEILASIETRNEAIKDWTNRVVDAAYTNNESYYNELLDLIERPN
jgi:signal transduction histidine kinase/tetratricopeptide (TPR) repeat protein